LLGIAKARSSTHKGDRSDAVFYIQSGKVKKTVVSEQGKEAVVAIFGANEFFGGGCLAGQTQRLATVAAITDAVVVRPEKSAIGLVVQQERPSPDRNPRASQRPRSLKQGIDLRQNSSKIEAPTA
jgi:hypothetical protein